MSVGMRSNVGVIPQDRGHGALAACGTRREPIPGGSLATSMPPRVPQAARTPRKDDGRCLDGKLIAARRAGWPLWVTSSSHSTDAGAERPEAGTHRIRIATQCTARTTHTDPIDRSLPARPRGTFGGMDAAKEPTGTYLRRVPRGWAGKDPATKPQIYRSTIDLSAQPNHALPRQSHFASCVVQMQSIAESTMQQVERAATRRLPDTQCSIREAPVAASVPPQGSASVEDSVEDTAPCSDR